MNELAELAQQIIAKKPEMKNDILGIVNLCKHEIGLGHDADTQIGYSIKVLKMLEARIEQYDEI